MTEQMIPALPTLAGMTREERRACQWMQADIESEGRAVLLLPSASGGRAILTDREGNVFYEDRADVTPRPDLPRLEWPGTKKPEPAPALPDGWRLADHKEHGRVVVTSASTSPNGDGYVYILIPTADPRGYDWVFCPTKRLTFLDTDQEADTTTGPGIPAVGTVIESADDPRIAALPVGSVLRDCDGENVAKRSGEWVGIGYIPIPSEGAEFGPWTVLRIGWEDDQ